MNDPRLDQLHRARTAIRKALSHKQIQVGCPECFQLYPVTLRTCPAHAQPLTDLYTLQADLDTTIEEYLEGEGYNVTPSQEKAVKQREREEKGVEYHLELGEDRQTFKSRKKLRYYLRNRGFSVNLFKFSQPDENRRVYVTLNAIQ